MLSLIAFSGLFCFSNIAEDFEKKSIKIVGEVFIRNNAYETLRILLDGF